MRAVVIQGSPHRDGPTAQLAAAFLQALRPDRVDTWRAFDRPVRPCDDCRACRTRPGCRHDDLDELATWLRPADLVVVATPVYNLSFPAPLKAVLDRSQALWSARFVRGVPAPLMKPKRAVLLTTAGASGQEAGPLLERQLRPVLTLLPATLAGSVHAEGLDGGRALLPWLTRAAALGRALAHGEAKA